MSSICLGIALSGCLLLALPRTSVIQDRTARALSAMSEAEAYHATLFADLAPGARPLDALRSLAVGVDLFLSPEYDPSVESEVRGWACANSVAVVGRIIDLTTHPTADGQFLFTTYRFAVVETWRSPSHVTMPAASMGFFVKPGGRIVIEGHTVEAEHLSHPNLMIGEQYLFMAHYLARTRALVARDFSAVFNIKGDVARKVGPVHLESLKTGIPTDTLEGLVRKADCRS